ncbi:MAG TPA: 30S ribosomal protein S8 [Sulfuricaulis sp.]|jgi:small subunit ribosomal protein S8|uniref:Small ribosomal subunit protein uS8 n=1 Tax=uncultured proteobacterium Rifle_16ft_4_minimus_11209 TaxID=1665205 RepID=A0A0H4TJU3_9PROT|nr:30S ribosomal protein S8 [uncultured proteobacterium Rifle_16ft_4_minimus_11209]HLE93985.1 30S ribosomal protein S8 [Sulfuricaulis sp.]
MMTDPIADMLTRIRNGQMAEKVSVRVPGSRLKLAIVKVLQEEGYVEGCRETTVNGRPVIEIILKYHSGEPVIERIERASKPGLRRYEGKSSLPRVNGGTGVAIVSTSRGIMSDRAARKAGLGGEILCVVS